jgi:polyphosphate kinase 2 (PPK2 family)
MARREILDRIQKYVDPFRITKGKGFRLKSVDPGDTCGLQLGKGEAAELLASGIRWLAEEQDMLYAQDSWSLLLMFQAMDAAGKDGTIKHVMSGVNPQGCQVFSFKQPSREDLDHDFLWRYVKCLPERGRIGLQPFVLRGGPRRACALGNPEAAEATRAERRQENLG